MSGDLGLHNEPIIFYCEEMTETKLILLQHKKIKIKLYKKVMKNIDKLK